MGRANRLLARWVDRVAVSFQETQASLNGTPSIVTGMPIRKTIGQCQRAASASRFGFSAQRPTLLVLGGSQGSHVMNRLLTEVVAALSPRERSDWQILHVTGTPDEQFVQAAYAQQRITAWVAPFLVEMEWAYASADVMIARAGASTIVELARCGIPAVLIPYPHAGGHQRANARLVERLGGALVIEEHEATAGRVLGAVRRLLTDQRLRAMMGEQVRRLAMPDAAQRLTQAVIELHQRAVAA